MKNILVFLSLLTVVGCSSQSEIPEEALPKPIAVTIYTNSGQGVASIISKKALESFNTEYLEAPENKAFAQAISGAWNWKSNRTSIEHAKTSALIGCQRNNKRSEDLYPCKIIHINGQWVK
jgi:hypothetical protein